MFGIGYQELLVLLMIAVILGLASPGIFYLIVQLGLKVLKSPRRVLIALWILYVACSIMKEYDMLDNLIFLLSTVILMPLVIAIQFAWLWLMGCLWQRVGWSRLGTAWRDMAALHFGSLRRGQTA